MRTVVIRTLTTVTTLGQYSDLPGFSNGPDSHNKAHSDTWSPIVKEHLNQTISLVVESRDWD